MEDRENEFQPLAIHHLNFQLLGRADIFSQLVQWSSMVRSMSCVFAIARLLGAPEAGVVLAVLFAATLPMGILQSFSTQNDYVVSFWLLALVSNFWDGGGHAMIAICSSLPPPWAWPFSPKERHSFSQHHLGSGCLAPSPARSDQPHPRNQRLLHRPA